MAAEFDDHSVRLAAFSYLDDLHHRFGTALPWKALQAFVHQGVRVPLIGAAGIWKPKCLDIPISITTSPTNPYGDTIDRFDGLLRYRYQNSAARDGAKPLSPSGCWVAAKGLEREVAHPCIESLGLHPDSPDPRREGWPRLLRPRQRSYLIPFKVSRRRNSTSSRDSAGNCRSS